MGFSLFGSSKSSSQSTDSSTRQANVDTSGDGATGVGVEGTGNTVTLTDQGAVAAAFGFGDSSLAFADAQARRAYESMTQSLGQAMTFSERAADSAMQHVFNASQPESAFLTKAGLIIGGIAAALVIGLAVWKQS